MHSSDSATTRLDDYITDMLPWAHGHQRTAIRDFVQAILDQQTGCQAQLARSFGNQEAATQRLARLLHNARLEPRHLADAVLLQALVQLPAHGPVRLAIDWTSEGPQPLLGVSLIVGRRAVPIYWRAYNGWCPSIACTKGRQRNAGRLLIKSGDESQMAFGKRQDVEQTGSYSLTGPTRSRSTSTFWPVLRRELPSAKARLAMG
jgi:hypothetical protein